MQKFKVLAQIVWLGACLFFFGGVIGVLTALNQQAGATTTLIAALFTLIGGSLVTLYRPPSLPEGARDWIVQAAGLICLGLLGGLSLGFYLRYVDQACLMTGIADKRAELDRELRVHGQCLADYWGELKNEGGSKDKADDPSKASPKTVPMPYSSVVTPSPVSPSVMLRAGVEELSQAAAKELSAAITRLDQNQKRSPEEQGRANQLLTDLKTHRDVIRQPMAHNPGYWLAHVEMARQALADLQEQPARDLLQELIAKGVEQKQRADADHGAHP